MRPSWQALPVNRSMQLGQHKLAQMINRADLAVRIGATRVVPPLAVPAVYRRYLTPAETEGNTVANGKRGKIR